jgi:hypothetical protein
MGATAATTRGSRAGADRLRASLAAYAAIWIATLIPAALVSLAGPALERPVRGALGLRLAARENPAPSAGHVLALAAHNLPIAAWPLLLGVLGANRSRAARHLADGLVLSWLVANTLPVAAALSAYGLRLVPYIPQLPLEWGGLALGAGAWIAQRARAMSVREGLAWVTAIACVLICAGVLESVAVPHR